MEGFRLSNIQYIKGDLFSDTESMLLHACNCRQNWGRGVAAEFAKRFPISYQAHKQYTTAKPGDIEVIDYESQAIICLFTSEGYGRYVDPPNLILKNTEAALKKLGEAYKDTFIEIASPKINAGLFGVEWKLTEKLIEDFLDQNPNVHWRVYVL